MHSGENEYFCGSNYNNNPHRRTLQTIELQKLRAFSPFVFLGPVSRWQDSRSEVLLPALHTIMYILSQNTILLLLTNRIRLKKYSDMHSPDEVLAVTAEGWVLEEPRNKLMVLHLVHRLLLESPLPPSRPQNLPDLPSLQ